MGVRRARFGGDGLFASGVELGEDLVDALAGDAESFGDFGDWFALIADGFDDGEISVRAVHLSTMSRLIPAPSLNTRGWREVSMMSRLRCQPSPQIVSTP